jgi:methyl-accepting chemotaxis protein
MPREAFQDLWQTLQAKKAWHGLVKNKRKNGDFYWVSANVSPILTNGSVQGYVSVRYPATQTQIATAEQLYADIRSGRVRMPWTKITNSHSKLMIMAGLLSISPLILLIDGVLSHSFTLASAGFFGMGVLALGFYQLSPLVRPSVTQLKEIEQFANGELRHPISGTDEWSFTLNMIRSRLAELNARNYDALRQSAMLTTAMNSASTNLMVVDDAFTILSINASLEQMLRRYESALQSALPQFKATEIVGSSMDCFHQHPEHQRAMLSQLSSPFVTTLRVAGLIIRLTVVPIMQSGKKIGYVVEWLDRTMEETIVEDIEQVVACMRQGNFDRRVTAPAEGNLAEIKNSVNDALANLSEIIQLMTDVVGKQALGDFTKQLESSVFQGQLHDLKNAINYSASRVKKSVNHAVQSSSLVTEASVQVSQGAMDLSGRVQQQAAALEQTSSTMHQIALGVQSNTANAHRVAELAHQVQHQTNAGVDVMKQTISAMQSISESSHRIADIVTIIDGISFQTNLLALNAAVEAARAGEHGKGFAVVASEVRSLAQRSASAAQDIKSLIDDSVLRIEAGTQLADKSGDMLNGITTAIEEVACMIEGIASASNQQSSGIQQVHKAISEIDRVTQENAALVEETSAAADSLKQEAEALRVTMAFFKT